MSKTAKKITNEDLARHVASMTEKDGEVRAVSFRPGKRTKLSPLPESTLRRLAYEQGVPEEGSGLPGAWAPEHAQRVILVPFTDESIDSYNTIFDSEGWDFRAYMQNPVVFFNHEQWSLPIGMTLRIDRAMLRGVDGVMRKGHAAHVLISPEELEPKAESVLRNWLGGRINGSSHGFSPKESRYANMADAKKYKVPKDAKLSRLLVFLKTVMRELSIVGMPSNTSTTSRSEQAREVADAGLLTREQALDIYSEEQLDGIEFRDEPVSIEEYLRDSAGEVVLTLGGEASDLQQRVADLEARIGAAPVERGEEQPQDSEEETTSPQSSDFYRDLLAFDIRNEQRKLESKIPDNEVQS